MTRRAPSVCTTPGCPQLAPCPIHAPKPWAGSQRRQRIGKSGSRQQADNHRILRAHHRLCHWCGHPDADQVDHLTEIADGGPDVPANKRPIHGSCPHCGRRCHLEKTIEARRRRPPGGVPPT